MSGLPHVLLINSKGPGGGGAHQAFQLVRHLQQAGCRVTFSSRPSTQWEASCREAGLAYLPLPYKNVVDLRTVLALRRYVREQQVDIIQVQKGTEFGLALPVCYLEPQVGLVVYRGVSFPLNFWNKQKYLLGRVDRVVAVAEFVRQQLVEVGIPERKVVTIYGGVDPAKFTVSPEQTAAARAEFSLPTDAPVIGMVAHLRRWKRHEDLLRAAASLLPRWPELRVLCVGRLYAEVHAELLALAEELGLGGRVTFTGERSDVPALLSCCSVSVNCADSGEGLTGALRESLFVGVPVVSTRTAGNVELIRDGETGLLVEPRQPEQLAAAMARLLSEPELASRVVQAGRELVGGRFTVAAQVQSYLDLYAQVRRERG